MWTIIFLVMGGLAIDTANAFREQEFLQVTADASAHAGAVELSFISQTEAKTEAIRVAGLNMRTSLYGNVLKDADITIGKWDHENRFLDTASAQPDAVRVITRRSSANANSVKTILLKLVGFDDWNLGAMSTVQRFVPSCVMDGIIAAGTAEMTTDNHFIKGYCIHGQQGVKISNYNYFEGATADVPGVVVSMNDFSDMEITSTGMATNTGLASALAVDWMHPRVIDKIDANFALLSDPTSSIQPSYITNMTPIPLTKSEFDASTLTSGNVYNVSCNGNQQISIGAVTLSKMVITTNCRISFGAGAALEDVVIATSSTSGNSISSSDNLRVGQDDGCTSGGGATLMTAGGISVASGLQAYGSQFIAAGDIHIAAQAGGLEGASFQTGGDFKMTSNSAMGNCVGNVDLIIVEEYYRIVE